MTDYHEEKRCSLWQARNEMMRAAFTSTVTSLRTLKDAKRREGERNMAKRRKVTREDMEPQPDPVWLEEGNMLKPSPFFLRWWRTVAQRRFGDEEHWLDAACELGYVGKTYDPETGKTYMEPVGFDYDPTLARASLGIPYNMPLISESKKTNGKPYQRLWDWLLLDRKEGSDGE